jgi:hypothetical protein
MVVGTNKMVVGTKIYGNKKYMGTKKLWLSEQNL